MQYDFVELFGYMASVVVAISLMQSNIVRLRLLNMTGALCFVVYGFMISAYPVAALNGFIALINLFYLNKLRQQKAQSAGEGQ